MILSGKPKIYTMWYILYYQINLVDLVRGQTFEMVKAPGSQKAQGILLPNSSSTRPKQD